MNNWIDRLERRYSHFAIPYLVNGLMVGHTYFVELFQVGRVYGYKVDALVQRQCIVFRFQ